MNDSLIIFSIVGFAFAFAINYVRVSPVQYLAQNSYYKRGRELMNYVMIVMVIVLIFHMLHMLLYDSDSTRYFQPIIYTWIDVEDNLLSELGTIFALIATLILGYSFGKVSQVIFSKKLYKTLFEYGIFIPFVTIRFVYFNVKYRKQLNENKIPFWNSGIQAFLLLLLLITALIIIFSLILFINVGTLALTSNAIYSTDTIALRHLIFNLGIVIVVLMDIQVIREFFNGPKLFSLIGVKSNLTEYKSRSRLIFDSTNNNCDYYLHSDVSNLVVKVELSTEKMYFYNQVNKSNIIVKSFKYNFKKILREYSKLNRNVADLNQIFREQSSKIKK